MRRTKIVVTLGPATDSNDTLLKLIDAGMDVARLNFSHGDEPGHRKRFLAVREASRQTGKAVAVIADLGGPKIRLGLLPEHMILKTGKKITLVHAEKTDSTEVLPHSYRHLAEEVKPGQKILLDDGRIGLLVNKVSEEKVLCTVLNGGPLSSHKGINLPGCNLSAPALTDKDKKDLEFAKALGVDFFALSFVRTAQEVRETKSLAGDIPVIAKIEKPEAIDDLDEILDIADGVMVARGDLGVEVGHEKVPLLQKRIIRMANKLAKPVITATQMLESMIHNPSPTRAEVSDVANAVLDGTDALMLSGETAIGDYPVASVKTMAKIALEVESSDYYESHMKEPGIRISSFSNAIADGAAEIARTLNLAAIAVYTESGMSAALVSAHRPRAQVIALSRHEKVIRRMCLYWGVHSYFGDWAIDVKELQQKAESKLIERGVVKPGDEIAMTFGFTNLDSPIQTTTLKLWRIEGE
ncbi:MAG: pyruvate kinase [Deltaproteobacteria bacterium]|nr:pyruvate kinase [Deltaproteobacteria bacterium]